MPRTKRKAAPSTTSHPTENEQLADVKTEHTPLLIVNQDARNQGVDSMKRTRCRALVRKKTFEQSRGYPLIRTT